LPQFSICIACSVFEGKSVSVALIRWTDNKISIYIVDAYFTGISLPPSTYSGKW